MAYKERGQPEGGAILMKKIICLAAALTLALTACGGPSAQESEAPTPTVTALTSAVPTPTSSTAVPTAAVSVMPATPAPTAAEVTAPPTPKAAPTPITPPPTPVSVPTPAAAPTPEPSPEPVPPERLSDEAVLAAYEQATEAYGWFTGYFEWTDTFLDKEDVEIRPNPDTPDLEYCRVIRPGSDSLDTLRGYLKGIFSDEIVDALLTEDTEVPHFIETEKGLYILCAGVGDGLSEKGAVKSVTVSWPEGELPVGCVVRVTQEKLEWSEDTGASTVVGEWVYEFPYQKVGDKWVFTEFESIF